MSRLVIALPILFACHGASDSKPTAERAVEKPRADNDNDDDDKPSASGKQNPLSPTTSPATTGPARTLSFDTDKVDAAPSGFTFGRTGQGAQGKWIIKAEAGAPSGGNVLAQVDGDDTDYRFPVAIANDPVLADVRLSVKCKQIAGKVDQGCGLIFRAADPDNYYLTRANALEDNVRLYHVLKGTRRQFAGWDGKVKSGVWHELRVDAKGNHFEVYFDGQKVIDATDDTFKNAGKIGVWTKADSIIYFDDLTVAPL
jgi:3-keto-disaccharide hydrolase